jgi:hypothetical protein
MMAGEFPPRVSSQRSHPPISWYLLRCRLVCSPLAQAASSAQTAFFRSRCRTLGERTRGKRKGEKPDRYLHAHLPFRSALSWKAAGYLGFAFSPISTEPTDGSGRDRGSFWLWTVIPGRPPLI